MPRDASGNYTLPAGNPVISGTIIESNWANSTMDDIAVAITDSLSRTGNGGMQVALTGTQGTAVNPSYSFVVDPLSGMYSGGTSDLRFSVASTDRMTITPTSIATTLPSYAQDGSASVPAYTFASDPSTGLYLDTVSDLRISVNNTDRMLLSSSAITPRLPVTASNGLVSAPAYSFESNVDTGMYLNAVDDLRFSVGGVDLLLMSTLVIQATAPFRQVDGTAGIPAYTFSSNPAYGMFFDGADNLGLTTGGTARLNITSTLIITTLPMQAPNGSASAPAYTFSTDPDTGMYLNAVGSLRFSVAGVDKILVSSTSITTRVANRTADGTANAPTYSFESDTDTGMYLNGDANLRFTVDNADRLIITSSAVQAVVRMRAPNGNESLPAYTFSTDTDTGMYLNAVGDVRMSVASVDQMRWINNSTEVFDSAASAFFPVLHTGNASRKNFIINGSIDLWQRGVSFSNIGYTADRWFNITAAITVDRVSSPFAGSAFALRVLASPGNPQINYHIELDEQGVNAPFINNTDYTLSFGMSDLAAGTDIRVVLDLVDNSAGSNPVSVVGATNVGTTINGVQRIEFTFNFGAPAIAGTNQALRLGIFIASDDSQFILGRVKLEQGSNATLFGPVSKSEELLLAQRYYEKSYNVEVTPGAVTNNGRINETANRPTTTTGKAFRFNTRKRINPTITLYSSQTGAIDRVDNNGDKVASVFTPGETGADTILITGGTISETRYHFTADAEI